MVWSRCGLALLLAGLCPPMALSDGPQVFWASDPVGPDETVLVQGCDLGEAVVELARLADDAPTAAVGTAAARWDRPAILQASGSSLKFTVPADWKPGIFAFRARNKEGDSGPVLLNAPDPWWLQGDEGAAATPGGWFRVFGKSLNFHRSSSLRLEPQQGPPITLKADAADCYALRFVMPANIEPGQYTARVHNGFGGQPGWCPAGTIRIEPPPSWPVQRFSVLDFYGKGAAAEMRKTLIKYQPIPDRTAGIQAALKKAKENGGGIVYFPAGRYGVKAPLDVPPRTVLKGEATGLVVLWWGAGRFNLDGGGEQGLARDATGAKPPAELLSAASSASKT
jgi:hypothetical protein